MCTVFIETTLETVDRWSRYNILRQRISNVYDMKIKYIGN